MVVWGSWNPQSRNPCQAISRSIWPKSKFRDSVDMPCFCIMSISFAINLDWEYNYTLLSTQLTNNLDDFNLQSESTVLSFKPNISYNFSKYVNGTVFYNYILTEDLTYGKSKENDFGFTVNIKIQG